MGTVDKIVLVDTNILLRFLLKENSLLSPKAKEIFDQAQAGKYNVYLDEIVLAETIWTMTTYYQHSKEKVCETLTKFISGKWVINPRKQLMVQALAVYSKNNLSYADAWLLAVGRSIGAELLTFDKKLSKLKP